MGCVRGMTEYVSLMLGDSLAFEHHKTTEQPIAAHYAEADVLDGVHVHFAIDQILTLYHDSTHRFGNIMEAYVNKSPVRQQELDWVEGHGETELVGEVGVDGKRIVDSL